MSRTDEQTIAENERFRMVRDAGAGVVLLAWRAVPGLGIDAFRQALTAFAEQCGRHRPRQALIDASRLDPDCPALRWVRGDSDNPEAYAAWWAREMVPAYNAAGFAALAVATGNPNAPGPVDVPEEATFKMGYFNDLDAASDWAAAVNEGLAAVVE